MKGMQVKITREQTSKYLDYFRQAHFAHLVPIRSKNTAVVERNGKKLYLADHSFASALTAPKAPGALLFENIVALHLMRKHGEKEVFYWRTGKGREVDFAVGPDDDVELTQVALELGNEETLEREVAALEEAMGEFKTKKSFIYTLEDETTIRTKTGVVEVLPVWKTLLDYS